MPEQRYLVTARKYRPQRFDELVAQDHVADTLRNALVQDRLAHAYLFSGPRGVGKTTAARILAKAINCTTPLSERDNGEACGECPSCESFQEGRNLNIFELDAASNNSVDDVRALREKVRIPPQGAKKKVYIVDEVHMLSNAAFNALLKTLEEPPPHVLFIFATTEPNKVLPTILSRCQRFDFGRIPIDKIIERLKHVCHQENIEYEDEALMLIAKKGDGALRDALSAFDQALALCGAPLTYDELAEALGVVDVDLYFQATGYARESNNAGMLHLVDEVVSRGYDLQDFLNGLAEHIRHLLSVVSIGSSDLIEASQNIRERYEDEAQHFAEADLLRMLMVTGDAQDQVRTGNQPRLQLELALLKLCHLERARDIETLIEKLEALEDQISGDAPETVSMATSDAPPDKTSDTRTSSPSSEKNQTRSASTSRKQSSSSTSNPTADRRSAKSGTAADAHRPETQQPGSASSPPAESSSTPDQPRATSNGDASGGPQMTEKTAISSPVFEEPVLKKRGTSSRSSRDSQTMAERQSSDPGSAPSTVAEPPPEGDEYDHPEAKEGGNEIELSEEWQDCVRSVFEERIRLGSYLQHTIPQLRSNNTLHLRVPDQHHQKTLSGERDVLMRLLSEALDHPIEAITFTVDASVNDETDASELMGSVDPFQYVKEWREQNDVVRFITDRFGGEPV